MATLYKKKSIGVCVCCFLPLYLTFQMETMDVVYKTLVGPRLQVCRECFDSLSDGRSYERCKSAGKTALRWECELLNNQNRVRVVGSQLFKAAGNTETGFSYFIYISFITAWQLVIKGVHVRASGVPPISSSSERLFGRYQLDFGFWLNMLLWRRLRVEAQIHYPLCFGQISW